MSGPRVGQGFDVHRFAPGGPLWLCGLPLDVGFGLEGHSDADVALHAVTDAVLGAAALGDIGEHFPPSDPRWAGAASRLFLEHAVALAAAAGFRLVNCDLTIIGERPRIHPVRSELRRSLAAIVGLPLADCSVKATTTEGLGFTGRGEGLAALAVVLLAGADG